MSATFNPDDFEDNNPFAEPVERHSPVVVDEAEAVSVLDGVPETNSHDDLTNYHHANSTLGTADSHQDDVNLSSEISEQELRKLLPERFSDRRRISIHLVAIEKNKTGNPILRFEASVRGIAKFKQSKYKDIRRSFNEIVRFNKYLSVLNLEVFVPVIPPAQTSFPRGGDEETKHLMFVWQEWFDRITSNPILILDDEFVFFIENNFGYQVINSQRRMSVASGIVRKTLKQLALPPDPYPDLESFRPLVKAEYLALLKLHKQIEDASKSRKQMAIHMHDAANKMGVLASCEKDHVGMKNMWQKMSKISELQSDLTLADAISDMATLGDGFQCIAGDLYEVKEALTNRYLIMRELAQAQTNTALKRANADRIKNKSLLDPFKVDEAIRLLESATQTQLSLEKQVKRLSGEMLFERKEVLAFEQYKTRSLMKQFILSKVNHHRKVLKHLENIRMDVRLVDVNGGLSRLNRHNLALQKHNLVQSQSASGDAWSSRTFRSLESKQLEEDASNENAGDAGDLPRYIPHHEVPAEDMSAKAAASLLGVATF